MKIRKIFLSAIWLFISLVCTDMGSAQRIHTSGNVEVHVEGSGWLGAIRETRLVPNFKFPKSGDTYYLHGQSEIWIGDANGNVASAWDLDPAAPGPLSPGEWVSTAAVDEEMQPDGQQIIIAQYDSSRTDGFPLNILVDQQSLSWSTSNHPNADDFIVIKLIVTNNSDEPIEGIYVAIMANWDVDGTDLAAGQLSRDWVDWDEGRQTLFTYDGDNTDEINPVHTGLTLLDGKLSTHQIFLFFGFNGRPTGDLFLDASRSVFMTNPNVFPMNKQDLEALGAPPWDYASIISAGPYDIAAKNSIIVIFALVAGEDLADLQQNIDEARRISFAPQSLTIEAVGGTVSLKWEEAINPSVDGYTVLRRAKGESEFRQIGQIIKGTTFDDTEIETGVEYTYKIRPVNLSEQPLAFDSLEVRITPDIIPDAPIGLRTTLSGDGIVLNWTKSTQQVNGYVIYRNQTGREPYTQIASVSPETTTFVDLNVYAGLHYFYTITATNRASTQSEFSKAADALIPEEIVATPESDLDNVIVVPNPYRLSENANPIEFRNVTRRATIRIYSSAGDLIKTIDHRNETSIERWNGQNEGGERIAAGIYVYHIESLRKGAKGRISVSGKFAVIR